MRKPIFIFAAGWRSGSTLLQRMITSSGEALIWGEPGGALGCFADAIERYDQMLGPGAMRYEHGLGGNGAESFEKFKEAGKDGVHLWIPCMNPPNDTIQNACRKMLENMYAMPASDLGYPRWGVKEVRSGIKTASFLKQLYPDAKFIFLLRDPMSCLLSLKRHNWMDLEGEKGALTFYAKHWKRLASEFRKADFGRLVRHEELVRDLDKLRELYEYIEIKKISLDLLKHSRVKGNVRNTKRLNWLERIRARIIIGSEMARCGY